MWGVTAPIQLGKEWKTTIRRLAVKGCVVSSTPIPSGSVSRIVYALATEDERGKLSLHSGTYPTEAAAKKRADAIFAKLRANHGRLATKPLIVSITLPH